MELTLINMLCIISILLLLTPCSSLQIHLQSSHEQGQNDKLVIPKALPRKLKLTEKGKGHEVQSTIPPNQHMGISKSGKSRDTKEKAKKHRSQGRDEEADPSKLLTMDYPRLRRRRPVHNKSLPVSP